MKPKRKLTKAERLEILKRVSRRLDVIGKKLDNVKKEIEKH